MTGKDFMDDQNIALLMRRLISETINDNYGCEFL